MAVQASSGSLGGLYLLRLLLDHARNRPDAPAMREKYLGIWQTLSWAEVAWTAAGARLALAGTSVSGGDNLAIIGDNRPHLFT